MGSDVNNTEAEIVEEEVIPIKYKAIHAGCGGEFRANGRTLPTDPPQYPHVCSKCGVVSNVQGQTFPSIGFKEKPLIHTLNS